MSRKTSRRSNSTSKAKSRSKMDRYTEDLRYSLRRSLGESVDKASLRADDILARSHRQIVADFTDPRQWYYSATHDYIIGMLRKESQRQRRYQESRYSHRSAMSMPRSVTSIGQSSTLPDGRLSTRGAMSDDIADRRKEDFIRIPTETSVDLNDIRRNVPAENRKATVSTSNHGHADGTVHHKKTGRDSLPELSETSASGNSPGTGSVRLSRHLPDDAPPLPTGDTSSVIQQQYLGSRELNGHTDPLNFSQKDEYLTRDGNLDNIHGRSELAELKAIDKVANSSTPAMETYRASKQSQSNLSLKDTSKSHPGGNTNFAPLPEINMIKEPFIPLEKRNSATFKKSKDVTSSFPSISQQAETSPRQSQDYPAPQTGRGNHTKCMSWKRKAGPKSTLDPMFAQRVDDTKYVEDWVKKLDLTDLGRRPVLPNPSIDPHRNSHHDHGTAMNNPKDRRPSTLRHHHHHHSYHNEPRQVKSMSLPNDFQSLPSFKPFHPMTSLYIYSMKQKSDLKVKLNHFQIPRPLRQQDDAQQADVDHTFESDLKEARSRVDYVETKLGELYETEKELVKVVARKTTKTTKKALGTDMDHRIAVDAKQISAARRQDGKVTGDPDGKLLGEHKNIQNDLDQQLKKVDSDVESIAGSPCQVNDLSEPSLSSSQEETHSKVSVVSLSLPKKTEEPVIPINQEETTGGETTANSHHNNNDLQQSPLTSPRKQAPTSPRRSKDVKVLEGKMIRVFDDHGGKITSSDSGRPLIRYDANGNRYSDHRSGNGNRDYEHAMKPDPSGLGISAVAEEVVREILDHLDSVDDVTERSLSGAMSESQPSPHGIRNRVDGSNSVLREPSKMSNTVQELPTSKGDLSTTIPSSPDGALNAPAEASHVHEMAREDTTSTTLSLTAIPRCIFCEDPH